MQWFYDPGYDYGSGVPGAPRAIHGFVLRKPSEIRHRLLDLGVVLAAGFTGATPVGADDLARVHDQRVIAGLRSARAVAAAVELDELAALPDELVWQLVARPQLHAAGGTYLAFKAALGGSWAVNLSGGFHHARRDLSHGFCLVNDVAMAVARLRQEGVHRRLLIVDLDLHQGDGNATCFREDRDVYTISVHEENLFPVPKARSDLDIGLPSWAGDDTYLGAVDDALAHAGRHADPEVIVFVAGADPYAGDPLGSLQVSRAGMLERDRRVARFARRLKCPLVVLPAGGYSDDSPAIAAAGFGAIAALEHGELPRE